MRLSSVPGAYRGSSVIAVADTSGLFALFNRAGPEHQQAATAADTCGLLVVSPLTLIEVHQVASIRADWRTADAIVDTLVARAETTRIAIAATTPRLLSATLAVGRQYADLNLDLAAAVVLAAEYGRRPGRADLDQRRLVLPTTYFTGAAAARRMRPL